MEGAGSKGKIFSRCHLAHILHNAKVDGYEGVRLADWLCFAIHVSNLDSGDITTFKGTHRDYGIFKLSNRDHCRDNSRHSWNVCQTCCTYFLNEDLSDDIQCLKRHIKHHKGLDTWKAWRTHCAKGDNLQYIKNCGLPVPKNVSLTMKEP
nr:PREDICTED: lysozyme C, milk isozyme [Anolis carolinensis]|eukprot:XP_008120565.1 PREDICTED: lysozyme C, milk isozyme [Anolis carolinensis]